MTCVTGQLCSELSKIYLFRYHFIPLCPRTDRSVYELLPVKFSKVKLFKENLKPNSKWWFNDYRMRDTFLLRPSQNRNKRTNGLLNPFSSFSTFSVIFEKHKLKELMGIILLSEFDWHRTRTLPNRKPRTQTRPNLEHMCPPNFVRNLCQLKLTKICVGKSLISRVVKC